jgi:hypothetical protein
VPQCSGMSPERGARYFPIMRTTRGIGTTVCAVLAAFFLVFGVIALTRDWARAIGSNFGLAAVFGVSAVLLWRRPGWRRVGVAFGLLILGLLVLYLVLVELHAHGHLRG